MKNRLLILLLLFVVGEVAAQNILSFPDSLEIMSGQKKQQTVNVQPSSRYRLCAYMRTAVGAEEIQLNVDGLKQNNMSAATALTAWNKQELLFQTNEKQTFVTVELYHPFSWAGNSAWAKQIILERVGEAIVEKRGGLKSLPFRNAKEEYGISQQSNEKMAWMLDAKFGMFIHWGLYAGPAQGEWYMRNKSIPIFDYRKYAYPESGVQQFLGEAFDASQWVTLAKEAGMKYMTLTAQHHDGYALFHSRYPDSFNSYQTHNRDFVKEYTEACRAQGLKVGLYKTLINWRYPGYYDINGTDCKKNSWGYITDITHKENARQMKEELYCMTKELLSNYGKIDYLFWDGGWLSEQGSDASAAFFWESGKYMDKDNAWPIDLQYTVKDTLTGKPLALMGMVRQLQPEIVVNPRCGWRGDFCCEEGGAKISGPIRSSDVYEKCLSLHYAWGYTPLAERSEKIIGVEKVKRYLVDCLMRNMCLMINVGPDRNGRITKAESDVLIGIGKWIRKVEEAVYGTRGGPWNPVDEQYGFSYKGNKIYVYLLEGFEEEHFILPSIDQRKVKQIYWVDNHQKLSFQYLKNGEVKIKNVSIRKENVRVLAIELKGGDVLKR